MRTEDKKYVWWGLLGIGVAALFYFLSAKNKSGGANTVTVPYLVPQTMSNSSSPSAGPSLSNQPNIIGSSPNSSVPNFTMPNLTVYNPAGPYNNVQYGGFGSPPAPRLTNPEGQQGWWTNSGNGWTFNPMPAGGMPPALLTQ